MKIKNTFMAALALSGATPALAQTANPVHRDAPVLNRTPHPDYEDRYEDRNEDRRYDEHYDDQMDTCIPEEARNQREYLTCTGQLYSMQNYRGSVGGPRGGDRYQIINPHNNSSIVNRGIREVDPGRIDGWAGRAARNFGLGSGTIIGGLQKSARHDDIMRHHGAEGIRAFYYYQDARDNGNQGEAANWKRQADSSFFEVGRLLDRYDQARDYHRGLSIRRVLKGETNRFFRNHRPPRLGF